ncbi:MAG: hypothetical protein KAG10_08920 [Methylococcales bacterium]|nr:hypothetical protein [Methylococcales bacterium]MCK5926000.1 hypothetical protein [Methylococcales bacterium]
MKKISILLALLTTLTLFGCSKGNEVSGRSMRSAYKSVNYIKNRLPSETRIEFEMSFWMLRDEIKNKSDFLSEVGGQTPEELIEIGKALYQKRKSAGYKEYEKFNSWDQMISHYNQERLDQNKKRKKPDPRDEGNSVIYKL